MRARRAALGVLIVVCTAGLTACGLPTIAFLEPPDSPGVGGGNPENRILTFQHNPANDIDDFRGYEIYYKLYYEDSTAVASDESFIEATPRRVGPGRLEARNFSRVAPTRISSDGGNTWTPISAGGIEPLIELMKSDKEQELTRALACAGLGIIGDINWIPALSAISKDINFRASGDAFNEVLSIL